MLTTTTKRQSKVQYIIILNGAHEGKPSSHRLDFEFSGVGTKCHHTRCGLTKVER